MLSLQEIGFDVASQGFIDDYNYNIFEKDKAEDVSIEKQKQSDNFIRMFNSTKFKKMYNKSMILEHWSWIKTILHWYMNTTNYILVFQLIEDIHVVKVLRRWLKLQKTFA